MVCNSIKDRTSKLNYKLKIANNVFVNCERKKDKTTHKLKRSSKAGISKIDRKTNTKRTKTKNTNNQQKSASNKYT